MVAHSRSLFFDTIKPIGVRNEIVMYFSMDKFNLIRYCQSHFSVKFGSSFIIIYEWALLY
jgi:hypothetical protein